MEENLENDSKIIEETVSEATEILETMPIETITKQEKEKFKNKKWFKILIIVLFLSFVGLGIYDLLTKKSFDYSSSNFESMNIYYGSSSVGAKYSITKSPDSITLDITTFNSGDQEKESFELTESELNSLLEIMKKYDVYGWNEIHKTGAATGSIVLTMEMTVKEGNNIKMEIDEEFFSDEFKTFQKELIKYLEDVSNQKRESLKNYDEETYEDDNFYGTVQVEGYITIEQRTLCDGDYECSSDEKVDYVFFNIVKMENTKFQKFIDGNEGNSFVRKNAIGLGCVADDILSYYNDSDANGIKEYKLSKNDTTKLLASTIESPITLELERLKYTSGSGAPTCYSHITTIAIK